MTEWRAIDSIKKMKMETAERYVDRHKAFDLAIKALQEIQQYQTIGTVDECREAMERQKGKSIKKIHPCKSVIYYQCPCCNELLYINENFCGKCGQAIRWEEE